MQFIGSGADACEQLGEGEGVGGNGGSAKHAIITWLVLQSTKPNNKQPKLTNVLFSPFSSFEIHDMLGAAAAAKPKGKRTICQEFLWSLMVPKTNELAERFNALASFLGKNCVVVFEAIKKTKKEKEQEQEEEQKHFVVLLTWSKERDDAWKKAIPGFALELAIFPHAPVALEILQGLAKWAMARTSSSSSTRALTAATKRVGQIVATSLALYFLFVGTKKSIAAATTRGEEKRRKTKKLKGEEEEGEEERKEKGQKKKKKHDVTAAQADFDCSHTDSAIPEPIHDIVVFWGDEWGKNVSWGQSAATLKQTQEFIFLDKNVLLERCKLATQRWYQFDMTKTQANEKGWCYEHRSWSSAVLCGLFGLFIQNQTDFGELKYIFSPNGENRLFSNQEKNLLFIDMRDSFLDELGQGDLRDLLQSNKLFTEFGQFTTKGDAKNTLIEEIRRRPGISSRQRPPEDANPLDKLLRLTGKDQIKQEQDEWEDEMQKQRKKLKIAPVAAAAAAAAPEEEKGEEELRELKHNENETYDDAAANAMSYVERTYSKYFRTSTMSSQPTALVNILMAAVPVDPKSEALCPLRMGLDAWMRWVTITIRLFAQRNEFIKEEEKKEEDDEDLILAQSQNVEIRAMSFAGPRFIKKLIQRFQDFLLAHSFALEEENKKTNTNNFILVLAKPWKFTPTRLAMVNLTIAMVEAVQTLYPKEIDVAISVTSHEVLLLNSFVLPMSDELKRAETTITLAARRSRGTLGKGLIEPEQVNDNIDESMWPRRPFVTVTFNNDVEGGSNGNTFKPDAFVTFEKNFNPKQTSIENFIKNVNVTWPVSNWKKLIYSIMLFQDESFDKIWYSILSVVFGEKESEWVGVIVHEGPRQTFSKVVSILMSSNNSNFKNVWLDKETFEQFMNIAQFIKNARYDLLQQSKGKSPPPPNKLPSPDAVFVYFNKHA